MYNFDLAIEKKLFGEYFKSDYLSYQLTVKGEIIVSTQTQLTYILISNQAGV